MTTELQMQGNTALQDSFEAALLPANGSAAVAEHPVYVVFSFIESESGARIMGMAKGLEDNCADQQPTVVQILLNEHTGHTGNYAPFAGTNRWTIENGVVTAIEFAAYGDTSKIGTSSLAISYDAGAQRLIAGVSASTDVVSATIVPDAANAFSVSVAPWR